MKTCRTCLKELPLDSFSWQKDRRKKDGGYYKSKCRRCFALYSYERNKRWRLNNQERAKAGRMEWHYRNRKRQLISMRKYYRMTRGWLPKPQDLKPMGMR